MHLYSLYAGVQRENIRYGYGLFYYIIKTSIKRDQMVINKHEQGQHCQPICIFILNVQDANSQLKYTPGSQLNFESIHYFL